MSTLKKVQIKSSMQTKSAANDLLNDGKRFARALYKDGVHQMDQVEEQVKDLSDDLLKKVQKNPLTSVLIAGGIGFLISLLFKK